MKRRLDNDNNTNTKKQIVSEESISIRSKYNLPIEFYTSFINEKILCRSIENNKECKFIDMIILNINYNENLKIELILGDIYYALLLEIGECILKIIRYETYIIIIPIEDKIYYTFTIDDNLMDKFKQLNYYNNKIKLLINFIFGIYDLK